MTGPVAAIRSAFAQTLRFHGRSTRSEYVWYFLLVAVAVVLLDASGWREARPFGSYPYARLLLILLAVPQIALTLRRLHDFGFSGWFGLLLLVPYVNLVVLAALILWPSRKDNEKWDARPGVLVQWPLNLLVGGLCLFGIALEPFTIPSRSMDPALVPGDYVISTPLSYGLPCFGLCGPADRFAMRVPDRGDVAVFVHPVTRQSFVKRVIGLPGETVEMVNGHVVINDKIVGYAGAREDWVETLPGGKSLRIIDSGPTRLDTFPQVEIPDGHVFVLGDNRDNSLDSRVPQTAGGIGMVPLGNLIGKARWILFSIDPEEKGPPVLSWPYHRFFSEVR